MKIDSLLSESEISVNELSKIDIERLLNEELTKENLAIIFDPNVTEDEKNQF